MVLARRVTGVGDGIGELTLPPPGKSKKLWNDQSHHARPGRVPDRDYARPGRVPDRDYSFRCSIEADAGLRRVESPTHQAAAERSRPYIRSVTVWKSIDLQHRERAQGVSRRSLAAYLSPPGPRRCPVGGGPSRLQGCGTVTCSPARRPYRPECWPCGIRSGWPRRCWHDGGRRARRCRLGADRAQQGSTVAGAAAVADPPPARQGRGTAGPRWWPPIWRARPYRALADTLPGRGPAEARPARAGRSQRRFPAGLAALIEGPATLILSTTTRGFHFGECRARG